MVRWVGGYLGIVLGAWKELVLWKGGDVDRRGDCKEMLECGGGSIG